MKAGPSADGGALRLRLEAGKIEDEKFRGLEGEEKKLCKILESKLDYWV